MSEKEDETFDLCSSSANAGSPKISTLYLSSKGSWPYRLLLVSKVPLGLLLLLSLYPFGYLGLTMLGFQNLRGTMQDFTVHYGSYQSHAAVEI